MYKILIVDDELMIREGIRNGMPWKKLSIDTVLTAASGDEALDILRRQPVDIILTDISMEGMTGLELVTEIRKLQPEIRVIIMTAYDRFDYAQESLRLHVDDFLLKPIDEDDLSDVIEKQTGKLDEISHQKHIQPMKNMREHTQMQREFQQLIQGKTDTEQVRMVLEKDGYRTDKPYEVVFFHMVHDDDHSGWENDLEFLWISLRQVIMEMVDNEDVGLTFYSKEDLVEVLLYCEEHVDEPSEVIEGIRNVIYSEFNTRVRVICSSPVSSVSGFSAAYREAVELMKESVDSYKTVMKPQRTAMRDELFSSIFSELKNEIMANVGNYQRIYRVFDVFVADTEAYNLSVTEIRSRCFELASCLYYAYVTESGEMAGSGLSEMITSLSMADGNEACEYTRKFISGLFGHIVQAKKITCRKAQKPQRFLGFFALIFLSAKKR